MPAPLVILLLMGLVIVVINPKHADYLWYRSLRRPHWLPLPVWSPLIQLCCYGTLYFSLLQLTEQRELWRWVIAYLSLVGLSEATLWFTCRTHRLKAGSLLGTATAISILVLAVQVHHLSSLAAALLLPHLLWCWLETLAQWQMMALNSGFDPNRKTSSMRTPITILQNRPRLRRRRR